MNSRSILFLLFLGAVAFSCTTQKRMTDEKVVDIFKESNLKGHYLMLMPDSLILQNGYFNNEFKSWYVGNFDRNNKKDLLAIFTVNHGLTYQFFLFNYKKNNQVIEVPLMDLSNGFLVPDKKNNFFYYYIDQKDSVLHQKEALLYKNRLVEKSFLTNTLPLDSFTISLRLRGREVVYKGKGEELQRYISDNGAEFFEQSVGKDTLAFIQKAMRAMDFENIHIKPTYFDDAPALHMNLYYSDGKSVEFEDQINFFTGGSMYYSVTLSSLYKNLFPEYFIKDYFF